MPSDSYPEVLQELKDSVMASLIEHGINEDIALKSAHAAAEIMRRNWGGMLVYICKGLEYEISQRDMAVWREYNGHNRHALCKKYDITEQWFYKIKKRQQEKEVKKRQVDLFGDEK